MIVKWHARAFLDEEKNKAVVFPIQSIDVYSVKVALEVVRAVTFTLDAELLGRQRVHSVDELVAGGVGDGAVEEGAMAHTVLSRKAEFFYGSDQ